MPEPDKERKLLNKKLLKSTFLSELKNQRTFKIFIDISTTFVALVLSDIIAQKMNISFWLYHFLMYLAVLLIITFIGKAIEAVFKKILRKN